MTVFVVGRILLHGDYCILTKDSMLNDFYHMYSVRRILLSADKTLFHSFYCPSQKGGIYVDETLLIEFIAYWQKTIYCILTKDSIYCILTKDSIYCILTEDSIYCILTKDSIYCTTIPSPPQAQAQECVLEERLMELGKEGVITNARLAREAAMVRYDFFLLLLIAFT